MLAAQILWSESMDKALVDTEQGKGTSPEGATPVAQVLTVVEATLNVLADSVLHEQPPVRRKKLEHLVSTPLVRIVVVDQDSGLVPNKLYKIIVYSINLTIVPNKERKKAQNNHSLSNVVKKMSTD